MVNAGREFEDTLQVIGRWAGHAADVAGLQREAKEKKTSLLAKLSPAQAEMEAVQILAEAKKIQKQRMEIRRMIQFAYGNEALEEWKQIQQDMKKQREKAVWAARRRKQELIQALMIGAAGIMTVALIVIGAFLAMKMAGGR